MKAAAFGGLHADVLSQVSRLRGAIDKDFAATDWRVETPLGERQLPTPLQAALSVRWPEGVGHTLLTRNDYNDGYDEEYEVTFPELVDGDPIAEDRACFVIAFNESTQRYWVVDLDDERPDDPLVHVVDHDVAPEEQAGLFSDPHRLSKMLAGLKVSGRSDGFDEEIAGGGG